MENGIMDIQADLLKEAIRDTTNHIRGMFKDKKPFRKVPMSDDEQLQEYLGLDPRVTEQLRQMPGWNEHESKMRQLIMRRGQNGRRI